MDVTAVYKRTLRQCQFYDRAHERFLWAMMQWGSVWAQQELVRSVLPLAAALAAKFPVTAGVDRNDLIQQGSIGALRAVEKFHPDHGRLTTYAYPWIRQKIQYHLTRYGHAVTLPNQVSERNLEQYRAARRHGQVEDYADGRLQYRHDFTDVDLAEDRAADRDALVKALYVLSDREVDILCRRASGENLKQIAASYGVTRERIRQLEAQALRRAREAVGVDSQDDLSIAQAK